LREKAGEARDAEILDLYLQCWTQEEIAEKIGFKTHRQVGNILNGIFGKDSEITIPDNLQFYRGF